MTTAPTAVRSAAAVMHTAPKTLPHDVSLGQVRAAFRDDHVHMLLLTRQGRLLGTLIRDDLPPDELDGQAALLFATLAGRTCAPDAPAHLLPRRVAVVAADGRLLGLVCVKRRGTGYCTAQDIAARAAGSAVTARGGPDELVEGGTRLG